jgi:predicted lipoprotein with Yx(FWY)xxD motif
MFRQKLILAAFAASLALPALAEDTMVMMGDTAMGQVLTDSNGMTLYTFDKDADGMSACYEGCAVKWPPALAAADAKAEGDYGVTARTDGTSQWTYKGMPLYTWYEDAAVGDTTGDGVGGVWHVAKP